MLIEQAYKAGKKIKKAILDKKGDINLAAYKIKESKLNKHNLSYEYLQLCLDYNVTNDNEFMLNMLAENTSSEDVAISLCLGLLSEDSEFITFSEATKRYKLKDSTLRKKRGREGFNEGETYKQGRDWYVSIAAMERLYGDKEDE